MMKNEKEGIGIMYSKKPTEEFELDFNKIKTVDDCVLVLKCIIRFINNGYDPKVYISNTCTWYEEMKHLAKDGSLYRYEDKK